MNEADNEWDVDEVLLMDKDKLLLMVALREYDTVLDALAETVSDGWPVREALGEGDADAVRSLDTEKVEESLRMKLSDCVVVRDCETVELATLLIVVENDRVSDGEAD